MPSHPPLCPKTQEQFRSGALNAECSYVEPVVFPVIPLTLLSRFPQDRRFIARYQVVAWEDRAERWWRLYIRKMSKWHEISQAHTLCLSNARAWRDWEKTNA